jgi:hypothetical protein
MPVTIDGSLGISATGNIISSGGVISAVGNIFAGNIIAVFAGSAINVPGTAVAAGNITGGNLLTAGLVSSTGNIQGGNIRTAGIMSSTGAAIHSSMSLGTPLPVASGGTGLSAAGTSGFALRSNGSAFAASKLGLGMTGEVWSSPSRAFNTQYTNSLAYPIAVTARTNCSGGSAIDFIVNGVSILNMNWQFNGCGSFGGGFMIVPPGQTYQLNSGQSLNYWRELS